MCCLFFFWKLKDFWNPCVREILGPLMFTRSCKFPLLLREREAGWRQPSQITPSAVGFSCPLSLRLLTQCTLLCFSFSFLSCWRRQKYLILDIKLEGHIFRREILWDSTFIYACIYDFPSWSKEKHVALLMLVPFPPLPLCVPRLATGFCLPTLAPCVLGLCVCHHTRSISLPYIIKITRDFGKETRFRKVYKCLIVSTAYINN